jgi:hypothetical protein
VGDISVVDPDINQERMYAALPITGYRDLNQTEINAMNNLKRYEAWIKDQFTAYCEVLKAPVGTPQHDALMAARQHFKEAFMWMNRAVARPTNEW